MESSDDFTVDPQKSFLPEPEGDDPNEQANGGLTEILILLSAWEIIPITLGFDGDSAYPPVPPVIVPGPHHDRPSVSLGGIVFSGPIWDTHTGPWESHASQIDFEEPKKRAKARYEGGLKMGRPDAPQDIPERKPKMRLKRRGR